MQCLRSILRLMNRTVQPPSLSPTKLSTSFIININILTRIITHDQFKRELIQGYIQSHTTLSKRPPFNCVGAVTRLAASVSGQFKHEGTTWHVITDAAGGTLDVPVWIRLLKIETVSVRVRLEAGISCVAIVLRSCKHHEVCQCDKI